MFPTQQKMRVRFVHQDLHDIGLNVPIFTDRRVLDVMSSRREYFRIRYPAREKLPLSVGGTTIAVQDLSEGGARLDTTSVFREGLPPQDVSVVFPDGSEFSTAAVFVRQNSDGTAIRFSRLVPLSLILSEQRRMRHRFAHVD